MISRQEIIDEMKAIASENYLSLFELVDEEKRNPDTVTVLFYHVETCKCIECIRFDLNKLDGPWCIEEIRKLIDDRMFDLELAKEYFDSHDLFPLRRKEKK